MNIQKTTRALNRGIVDNSTPTTCTIVRCDGSRQVSEFPGWPTLHYVADRMNAVLRREAETVLVLCVSPEHALEEFWGTA